MKKIWFVIFWLITFIADGIIIPGFFKSNNIFLNIIFLVSLISSLGISEELILVGLVISFINELFLGLYFGSLMLAWLITIWFWYLITRFFSLKPYRDSQFVTLPIHIIINFLLLGLMGVIMIFVQYIYSGIIFREIVFNIIKNLDIYIFIPIASVVYLIILRKINQRLLIFYG
jgi:hypothetical protein